MHSSHRAFLVVGLLGQAITVATLSAQSVPSQGAAQNPAPDKESPLELSPFVVNSTKDTGYQAMAASVPLNLVR